MAQEALPGTAAPASPAPAAAHGARRKLFVAVVVLAIAAGALAYWLHSRQFAETDDAQIDGSISNVSPASAVA